MRASNLVETDGASIGRGAATQSSERSEDLAASGSAAGEPPQENALVS